jgi:hypothetical protein
MNVKSTRLTKLGEPDVLKAQGFKIRHKESS